MMQPYATIRLRSEQPGADVADIKAEARPTRVGRVWHVQHGYTRRPAGKRAVRRALKRADKARSLRAELLAERQADEALARELEEYNDRIWGVTPLQSLKRSLERAQKSLENWLEEMDITW